MVKAATPKPSLDLPIMEADYRAGIKSIRQIAREHGVSETAIRKRADREGWTRDLSAAIQAKADDMVRRDVVRTEVRTANRIPEKVVIEANAATVYQVQIAHRAGLTRLAGIRDGLLSVLEAQPDDAKKGDKAPKPLTILERVDTLKKLSEVDEKIRKGEREAYGIDKIVPDEGGIVSVLSEAERASRAAAILQLALKRRDAEKPRDS
ncbi:MAG TPA: hypothetical protein VN156_11990 [Pseudomonas sp.]|nr:hypothetical protein [Pseudomonas sp.]